MSKNKDLGFYLKCFSNLKRDRKNGGAPHKPILLLSIIDLFESGVFDSNKIFINPELVSSFKSNWASFVLNQNSSMSFALPFYHMRSEPFWRLVANPGCETWVAAKSSMRSFSNLNTAIKYAQIDIELCSLLLEQNSRNILYAYLLKQYFPESKYNFPSASNQNLTNISNDILKSNSRSYIESLKKLESNLDKNSFEEEVFIRNGIFKREIPRIYEYKCCISGLRVDAINNITIIDACHIRPFSECYDDTITNGLALCPTLHRAFDRGLISIDEKYRVIVSPNFKEPHISVYSITQFHGCEIFLPTLEAMRPSQESLRQHRIRFGFQ